MLCPLERHIISPFASIFLDDMGDQAEVVLHQDVAGLQVALLGELQVFALLLRLQGLGEGAGVARQAQGEEQGVEREHDPG